MKVLHIITRMNTGGPAVFLDHLTSAMNDLDTQSTIAYGYCESNEADYTDTHKLNSDLLRIKTLHRSLNPFDDLKAFFALRRIIKEINPDLVNTHTSKAGVLGRIATKSINRKIPVVHTYHGHLIYGYFAKYKTFVFTLIERFLALFTNAAVSITKETQTSLQKLKIGKKLKWSVIHLGIPVSSNSFLPLNTGNKLKLLWVGRFTDIKDPAYAVKVTEELENLSPGKFELSMVGGGELLEPIKKIAQNLPVTFFGWLDKPFENSGHFDLLLLTSKNEGMGLVMLEAANYRKPTVARDVGGIGEFIAGGVNGLLIDGGPAEMANQINSLKIEEVNKMGEASYQVLVKDFTDKVMANNYFNLYKSLI
jgi:glycosyltransferase involved in cell wall biosynthesis